MLLWQRRQGRRVGGTGCMDQALFLSHCIWGSPLYLIPVISRWGPWWPEPLVQLVW